MYWQVQAAEGEDVNFVFDIIIFVQFNIFFCNVWVELNLWTLGGNANCFVVNDPNSQIIVASNANMNSIY